MDYSDELPENVECDTDPTDRRNLDFDGKPREPWRCDYCHKLIHATDNMGRPVAGAPLGFFVSQKYKRVCSLCYDLHENPRFTLDYWKKLQAEYNTSEQKRRKDIDGLSGRTDYFTGA